VVIGKGMGCLVILQRVWLSYISRDVDLISRTTWESSLAYNERIQHLLRVLRRSLRDLDECLLLANLLYPVAALSDVEQPSIARGEVESARINSLHLWGRSEESRFGRMALPASR
jgi:hypothetical protein